MHQFPLQACLQTGGSEQGKDTNKIPKGFRAQIVLLSVALSPPSPLGCHKIHSSSHRRCNFKSFASKGKERRVSFPPRATASIRVLAPLPSWEASAPEGARELGGRPAAGSHTATAQGANPLHREQRAQAPYRMGPSTWNKPNDAVSHLSFETIENQTRAVLQLVPRCTAQELAVSA